MQFPSLIALQNDISKEFPDFRIRRKADSTLMRWIHWFLLIVSFGKNKSFLTDFVTTIGTTVYVPDSWEDKIPIAQCMILRHELVHMRQAKKYGMFLFSFLYLFWPIPVFRATWRTKFEKEAYEETIRAFYEYGEDPTNLLFRIQMVKHFVSSEYMWMWTDREAVEEWLNATISKVMGAHKN